MRTVDDKTVISGLRWYTSDQYRITVGGVDGVGGDFRQTVEYIGFHYWHIGK